MELVINCVLYVNRTNITEFLFLIKQELSLLAYILLAI